MFVSTWVLGGQALGPASPEAVSPTHDTHDARQHSRSHAAAHTGAAVVVALLGWAVTSHTGCHHPDTLDTRNTCAARILLRLFLIVCTLLCVSQPRQLWIAAIPKCLDHVLYAGV